MPITESFPLLRLHHSTGTTAGNFQAPPTSRYLTAVVTIHCDTYQSPVRHLSGISNRLALVIALVIALAGCGGSPSSKSEYGGTPNTQVTLTSTVTATQHPLVAKYSITLPVVGSVYVEFGRDTNYGRRTNAVTAQAGATAEILVAGMRPSTEYHMHAVITTASGAQFDSDHTFTTGVPPAALAQLTVKQTSYTPSPGVELLDLVNANQQLLAAAVDLDGTLVWYYYFDDQLGVPFPIRLMPNGHFLINIGLKVPTFSVLREIDLAGNTVRELTIDSLNALLAARGFSGKLDAMHHEVLPLENGHVLVLGMQSRDFSNLAGQTGVTTVTGDVIVDLDASLSPVWTWSTFDYLDVNRHPSDVHDWTHSNALVYSPADCSLLLSIRNQNWIVKIDYGNGSGTGRVLWRLGQGGDFVLTGAPDTDWFFGQHFPAYVSDPSVQPLQVGVFDNRATNNPGTLCQTDTGNCYSRPVIFRIDEARKTAEISFAQRTAYSFFGGNIGILPNGDVEYDLAASNGFSPQATIQEVRPSDQALVWEMDILGQFAYRAYRVPSLYPGVQW
ncbi:MAG: aryl-sulfate sulfotransferase [Terriglobales bacterium]